jgi:Uma2 family endonuclease
MSVVDIAPGAIVPNAAQPPVCVWRLSVEQYEEMIRVGILTEDDPVELLDGWLVPKMPKKPAHVLATELARDLLEKVLPEGWHVNSQQPVRLATSEPEPDAMVVRGARRDYRDRLPLATDVSLVVEVADTSLQQDQTFKKAIYAAAAVPVYWIINLVDRRVEVLTAPGAGSAGPEYGGCHVYRPGEAVPVVIAGRDVGQIPAGDLLP